MDKLVKNKKINIILISTISVFFIIALNMLIVSSTDINPLGEGISVVGGGINSAGLAFRRALLSNNQSLSFEVLCTDNDNDSYGINNTEKCASKSIDCNDSNPNINPGATETCNGIDDDCDSTIDEDYVPTETTCGIGACYAEGLLECINGVEINSCTPGTSATNEICNNTIDDDCDGSEDCVNDVSYAEDPPSFLSTILNSPLDNEIEVSIPLILDVTVTDSESNNLYMDFYQKHKDLSFASYEGISFDLESDSCSGSLFINSDGTRLYHGGRPNYMWGTIYQYSLDSPWDLSTAVFEYKLTGEQNTISFFFNPDGTKLYELRDDRKIYQHSLSTAGDLSTASYDGINVLASASSYASEIFFNSAGTKMYVLGRTSSLQDMIYQYSLNSPWDLSTLTYTEIKIEPQDIRPAGISFSSNGKSLYEIGTRDNKIYGYSLDTAWDLSTASYDEVSISTQSDNPKDLFIGFNDMKLYEIGEDNVYQYSLDNLLDSQSQVASDSDVTYTWDNLDENTNYEWYAKITSGPNTAYSDVWAFKTNSPTLPPSSVSNLNSVTSTDSILWNWNNPNDPDFDECIIYINNKWQTNTSNNYYNLTDLNSASYEIVIHTKDTFGNINDNDVSDVIETQITCEDKDNDGYGTFPHCDILNGCTYDGDDCNDDNSSINPGAIDIVNGIDDDCDGFKDTDPYIITTCRELENIASSERNTSSGMYIHDYYVLGQDIDCSDSVNWDNGKGFKPVDKFFGTLDGNGYKIINLTINRPDDDYVGLISYNGVKNSDYKSRSDWIWLHVINYPRQRIENIIFENIDIKGRNGVGALFGVIDRWLDFELDNIHITGQVEGIDNVGGVIGKLDRAHTVSFENLNIDVQVSGNDNVGGIAGYWAAYHGDISKSIVKGPVNGNNNVGGFVGAGFAGHIVNSASNTDVTGNNNVGGFVGMQSKVTLPSSDGSSEMGLHWPFFIEKSFSSGNIHGVENVAGLYGFTDQNAWVYNSYSNSNVQGTSYVGGLIGKGLKSNLIYCYSVGSVVGSDYVGGLVGFQNSKASKIKKSFAANHVTGNNYVGSLVGYNNNSYIIFSYFNNATYNPSSCIGAGNHTIDCISIQDDEDYFKRDTVFPFSPPTSTWDFFNTWEERENDYPSLTWQHLGNNLPTNTITEGSGTESDPYIIKNCIDLQSINNDLNSHYKLANDIDCSETRYWGAMYGYEYRLLDSKMFNPIGNESSPFNGVFDGNGHTITNLYINNLKSIKTPVTHFDGGGNPVYGPRENNFINNIGLFGYTNVNSEIKNIGLENVKLISRGESVIKNIGALVGYNKGLINNCNINNFNLSNNKYHPTDTNKGVLVGYNEGTISNSHVMNGVIDFKTKGGGLIGYSKEGIISGCSVSNVSITARSWSFSIGSSTGYKGNSYAGGLIGFTNQTTIKNSFVKNSSIISGIFTGGFIGYSINSDISNSYTIINNIKGSAFVGGFIGYNTYDNISNSYSNIDNINIHETRVSSDNIFTKLHYHECNVGGFIGYSSYSNIKNSYALVDSIYSKVSWADAANSGGFIGELKKGVVKNSYSHVVALHSDITDSATYHIGGANYGNLLSGGLIGYVSGHSLIDNTYSESNMFFETDSNYVSGGLINSLSPYEGGNYVSGGLIGSLSKNAVLNNSFATGSFNYINNEDLIVGGIVGYNHNSYISNSFYNNATYTPSACIGAGNHTIDCISIQDNEDYFKNDVYPNNEPMASWDFSNVWKENSEDYPSLTSQDTPPLINSCTDNDEDGYSVGIGDCGTIDCNDINSNIHPNAAEICNGIDDDCDDLTDEDYISTETTCGVGVCAGNIGQLTCTDGTQLNTCDPFEGATDEICNNIVDDDCDGFVDCKDINCIGSIFCENSKPPLTNIFVNNLSTNFSNVEDISAVPNLAIGIPNIASVSYHNTIDLTNITLDPKVSMSHNYININSSAIPQLNKSAEIKFYNLTFNNPQITKDGTPCKETICKIKNYSTGTLTFNVTHFTSYSAQDYCGNGYCDNEETCSSCPTDCGSCSGGSGGSSSSGTPRPCQSNWNCTQWEPLICPLPTRIQTRNCTDLNECGTPTETPIAQRNCQYTEEQKKDELNKEDENINESIIPKQEIDKPSEIKEETPTNTIKQYQTSITIGLIIILIIIITIFIIKKQKNNKKQEQEEQKTQTTQQETQTPTQELKKYIQDSLEQNIDVNTIRSKLLDAGWNQETINETLQQKETNNNP